MAHGGMRVGYPGGYMGGSPGGSPSPTMAQGYLGGSMRGRRTDFGDDSATSAAESAAASAGATAAADTATPASPDTGMATDMAGQPTGPTSSESNPGSPPGSPTNSGDISAPPGEVSPPPDDPATNSRTPWSPPPPADRLRSFLKGIFSPTPANIGSMALTALNPSPLGALMAAIKGGVAMANNDIGAHAMNAGMTNDAAAADIAGQVAGVQGAATSTGVGQGGPMSSSPTMAPPSGMSGPRPIADTPTAASREPDPSSPLIDQNDYIKRRFGGLTVGT